MEDITQNSITSETPITSPVEQQPTQPTQNKSSTFSKWIRLFLIGIASLIIVLGGVYLLGVKNQPIKQAQQEATKSTPTSIPNPTTTWQTYTITNNKYSIKYPSNWKSFSTSNVGDLSYFTAPRGEPGYGNSDIDIRINKKATMSDRPTIDDSLESYIKYIETNGNIETSPTQVIQSIKKITAEASTAGYLVEWKPNGSFGPAIKRYTTFFELPNDKSSTIEIGGREGHYLDIYNLMITTFKFIDQNQTSDTTNWKTYTNSQYNLSIQYPSSWYETKGNGKHDGSNEDELVRLRSDNNQFGGPYVGISIFDNTNNLTAKEYVEKLYSMNSAVHILKEQPNYFQSSDAVLVNGIPGAGPSGPAVFINDKKGSIIELYTTGLDQKVIDSIFSTFKFQ